MSVSHTISETFIVKWVALKSELEVSQGHWKYM